MRLSWGSLSLRGRGPAQPPPPPPPQPPDGAASTAGEDSLALTLPPPLALLPPPPPAPPDIRLPPPDSLPSAPGSERGSVLPHDGADSDLDESELRRELLNDKWRQLFDKYDPEGFGEIPWDDFVEVLNQPEFAAEVDAHKRDILLERALERKTSAITFQDFVNVQLSVDDCSVRQECVGARVPEFGRQTGDAKRLPAALVSGKTRRQGACRTPHARPRTWRGPSGERRRAPPPCRHSLCTKAAARPSSSEHRDDVEAALSGGPRPRIKKGTKPRELDVYRNYITDFSQTCARACIYRQPGA
ncbi:uncharacterized protein LOC126336008 [Schistocerca gregaria]|uniref:uncharacterized protein LOC126336008 n=1 Tax=Schistocerca gregaria TaxID=7010 RepID=UPI00211EDA89|nr:uncharacterized protein LOC126336008 [Schistocerca gregaria]